MSSGYQVDLPLFNNYFRKKARNDPWPLVVKAFHSQARVGMTSVSNCQGGLMITMPQPFKCWGKSGYIVNSIAKMG